MGSLFLLMREYWYFSTRNASGTCLARNNHLPSAFLKIHTDNDMLDFKFGFPMLIVVSLIIFSWVMFFSLVFGYNP